MSEDILVDKRLQRALVRGTRQEASNCQTNWHSFHQFGVYIEVILQREMVGCKSTSQESRVKSREWL